MVGDNYRAGFSLRLQKWCGVTLNKPYSLLWGEKFVEGMAKRIRRINKMHINWENHNFNYYEHEILFFDLIFFF